MTYDPREANRLLAVLRESDQCSDRYSNTLASLAILFSQNPEGIVEVVSQCAQEPVWDGDVASKYARDKALKYGFIVKCAYKNQQGYQVATYLGWELLREIERQKGLATR